MAGVDSGISFGRPALLQVEPRSLLLSIGLHWLRLRYYTQVGPWGPLFGVMLLCSGVAPLLVRTIRRTSMVAFLCLQQWDFHSMVVNFWQGDSSTIIIDHWHESILFILWKGKGDPQDLNTHRGVVLLDVISKVVWKLITSRLASLAEHVCGESELAYRKGRGCSDGLFTIRRLLQEWRGSFFQGQPAEDVQL